MTGPVNPIRPDGPLSWYSMLEGGPGHFPPFGSPHRLVGGPFDGDMRKMPAGMTTVRLVAPLEAYEAFRAVEDDERPTERGFQYAVYSRHELVHQPDDDAEGPVGIEWVWMTDRAFAAATKGQQ